MRRRELALPVRMTRVAVVVPETRLRQALVALADAGTVELVNPLPPPEGEELEALRRLQRRGSRGKPLLSPDPPDPAALERAGAADLLAGEVELQRRAKAALRHGPFAGLVGWTPEAELPALAERLAGVGAAVVPLPMPPWADPPTLLRPVRPTRAFQPLVETYGAARYADVDPTPFAALSFVLMFGMMFGDVGHGLALAALGLALRRARRPAGYRAAWPLLAACGLSGALFGLLYGEAFGPTGLVPALWLDPLEEPVPLLVAALAVGAVLLGASYALGTVNRFRESGPAAALLAPSGVAGFLVFAGGGLALVGLYWESWPAAAAGAFLAALGALLLGLGFMAEAGRGGAAVAQATVEVVDAVVRVGASAVSFTRLAAFGLMHGAVAAVVLQGSSALAGSWAGWTAAVSVLVVGNIFAFALEALVAAVQALRLEYYELFSRIFAGEGRPFSPWHIPLATRKEEP